MYQRSPPHISIHNLSEHVPAWTKNQAQTLSLLQSQLNNPRQLKELFKARSTQEIICFPVKKNQKKTTTKKTFPQHFPLFLFENAEASSHKLLGFAPHTFLSVFFWGGGGWQPQNHLKTVATENYPVKI